MKEKIVAVIPAFNEEETISGVVENLKRFVDEVVVVDDASSDKTSEEAEKKSAIIVKNKENLGYDGAINEGFKQAAKINASIIFTFDADGQHVPEDILGLIAPIRNKEADVVVGIRPYNQRISEKIFSKYARKKIGIKDPLCGIKAYSAEAFDNIGYFDSLNSIGTELMFNCHKNGFKIKEVKVHMNKRQGKPRFGSAIKSNIRIFSALLKVYIKFR